MEFDACNSYIWPRKAIRDGQGKFGITLNDPTTFKLFSHMKAINQYTEMWMQRWRRALLAFPFHSRFFITSPPRLSLPSVGAARGETAATAAPAPAPDPVSPVMPVSRPSSSHSLPPPPSPSHHHWRRRRWRRRAYHSRDRPFGFQGCGIRNDIEDPGHPGNLRVAWWEGVASLMLLDKKVSSGTLRLLIESTQLLPQSSYVGGN